MSIVLTVLATAFAAFCIWLTVRIVNRRERWAKWTAVGSLIGIPVLYVLSIGPVFWFQSRGMVPASVNATLDEFYIPVGWVLTYGPKPITDFFDWYLPLWVPTLTFSGPGPHVHVHPSPYVRELKP
jgi:hypothetical protein